MNANRRTALAVGIAMVGGAGLAEAARPRVHLSDIIGQPDLEQMFPKEFGTWRIDTNVPVVLPSPDVQALLNAIYNQVLGRTYVNIAGDRIMLSVAYGGDQSDGTRAHRPEVCYPAQGFQIAAKRSGLLQVDGRDVKVMHLMARLGGRFEPISYWVVVGDNVTTSGTEQKIAQLRYGLRGIIPDGMLVRVSNIEPNLDKGLALHRRFVNEMAQAMTDKARDRAFGTTRSSNVGGRRVDSMQALGGPSAQGRHAG